MHDWCSLLHDLHEIYRIYIVYEQENVNCIYIFPNHNYSYNYVPLGFNITEQGLYHSYKPLYTLVTT